MKNSEEDNITFFYLEDLLYNIVFEASERVSGDGCSIFLWDEEVSTKTKRVYKCIATTGLEEYTDEYKSIENIESATYEIPDDTNTSITAYVISNKQNIVIKDIHDCNFKKEYNIRRRKGAGKVSEVSYTDATRVETGPFMATPLFF